MTDTCGVYGENAVYLLSVLGNHKVNEPKCYSMDEDKKVNTFSRQIEYWMDYVILGIEINTDEMTELRIGKMSLLWIPVSSYIFCGRNRRNSNSKYIKQKV